MKNEQIYNNYYSTVYHLSLLLLKNKQDAEDAAQAVFLKLMEKAPDFRDEEHTKAWLLTVTRNHCHDIQRSFWHKNRANPEHCPEPSVEPFNKQSELLFEIFQTLPVKQREVVYLYYLEDYSIKEIASMLNRNESTIQSQLFAARKKLKKHFSTTKAAVLVLCIAAMVGFSRMAADAATGGDVRAALHEVQQKVYTSIRHLISDEDVQVADETVTLPMQVYAPQLAGISSDFVILANERGLLIYDRSLQGIVDVIDLQEIDCNYLNADSIATRIFLDSDRLYLFNEALEEAAQKTLPTDAYVYDLSLLNAQLSAANQENAEKSNDELTFDESALLTHITDESEIKKIVSRWDSYAQSLRCDTFEQFTDADFLKETSDHTQYHTYSRESLNWTDASGNYLLSCLVVFNDSDYKLYTKDASGAITAENLSLTTADAPTADNAAADSSADAKKLPTFAYSGEDAVLAAVCDYMCQQEFKDGYLHEEDDVYIPAPLIYGTAEKDGDLYVFCNMWNFWYYQNGNTLECESGGEAPARLLLHPNPDAAGGYEITEDLRTGDGAEYERGIREFCEGFDGMAERYFSGENGSTSKIRTELIRMYVSDNQLPIKYYKDYGWDPVSVE